MSAISRQYGALLLSLGLTGCAGWSQNIPVSSHEKIRIAILPVENVAQIGKLTEIVSQPAALPEEGEEQVVIQRHLRQVTADMTRRVEDRLSSSPCFLVVPNAEVSAAMDVYATHLPPDGLSDEDLRWLGSATRAEVVLQISLSGYGQIKRKWLVYLIGSGVVEGVVQGVVVGKAVTGWAGVVVAAEEIAQEVLTWGGGAALFKSYYSPVTLEGRLVNVVDGKTLWHDTAFVSTDRKELKRLPEEESARKETQLVLTAAKAEKELLDDLFKAAGPHRSPSCQ